jgi:hypothetical protein
LHTDTGAGVFVGGTGVFVGVGGRGVGVFVGGSGVGVFVGGSGVFVGGTGVGVFVGDSGGVGVQVAVGIGEICARADGEPLMTSVATAVTIKTKLNKVKFFRIFPSYL